jgi:hypothetical protein
MGAKTGHPSRSPSSLDRATASLRLIDLPAGGPDRRPIEQHLEFEGRPAPLGYRERPLGEPLRSVDVAALQREAGQCTQAIHDEDVLTESQPGSVHLGRRGGIGSLSEVAGLEPCAGSA